MNNDQSTRDKKDGSNHKFTIVVRNDIRENENINGSRGESAQHRKKRAIDPQLHLFLPNVKAQRRTCLARSVLLGARSVTSMFVRCSAWFGVWWFEFLAPEIFIRISSYRFNYNDGFAPSLPLEAEHFSESSTFEVLLLTI